MKAVGIIVNIILENLMSSFTIIFKWSPKSHYRDLFLSSNKDNDSGMFIVHVQFLKCTCKISHIYKITIHPSSTIKNALHAQSV